LSVIRVKSYLNKFARNSFEVFLVVHFEQ